MIKLKDILTENNSNTNVYLGKVSLKDLKKGGKYSGLYIVADYRLDPKSILDKKFEKFAKGQLIRAARLISSGKHEDGFYKNKKLHLKISHKGSRIGKRAANVEIPKMIKRQAEKWLEKQ